MASKNTLVLSAVGDITAFRKNPETAFEYVRPLLQKADLRFAQNERFYSDRTDLTAGPGFGELTSVKHAEALKLGGFDVISFASNHSMDYGPQAMLETVAVLRKLGFAVIGAGKNLKEARKPVILERKGTRVAFLAYASVLREGAAAGPEKAGVAPMRAYTLYQQTDYQPGTPPEILTFPYKEDLAALIEDIKKVKARADIVAVSMHWGIHFYHALIAGYQKEVAHAAIDAGADIILGHHAHVLKGIEVYKGRPVFYSMGNFALDLQPEVIEQWKKDSHYVNMLEKLYHWKVDPAWSMYAFPPESRKSMIVQCNIVNKKISRVSFLPVLINQKAQPRAIPRKDKNFAEMFKYMTEITESEGLETRFSIEGNEIVVKLA